MSGPVLTAQSLEPASDSVSPSLSAPSALMLSLSQKQTLKNKKKNKTVKLVEENTGIHINTLVCKYFLKMARKVL